MGVNFVTFSVHASHRGRHQMCWSNKSPSHVSLLLESCVTRRKNPLIINPQDFQSACQKVKILINSCLPRCPLEWLRYKSIRAIPLIHVIFKIFEISKIFDEYLWHSHITVYLFYFSALFMYLHSNWCYYAQFLLHRFLLFV